ncbi:16S rRNA (cytosine(1402)-N(4))-methyltransferase RsmH [Candidatus Dependentiae bacterium]|nr:16S rRNA (cytosine(1402)-N(4))-methyltransferase RsmH [Candidatus Dependentiae bacterium]
MIHDTVPHKSVLVDEVIEHLAPQPGKTYLDVTFGAGGHSRAILEAQESCHVIGMDWDTVSLEKYGVPMAEEFGKRLSLAWGNFSLLYRVAKREHIKKVDGILADFGTSQMQITERPGFSFSRDTPLDMRMSPSHQQITAAYIIASASEEELADIFFRYGEERYSRKIARLIVQERKIAPIATTGQLATLVSNAVGSKRGRCHPATRVFQALRIAVNKELENITSFLSEALRVLSPGGRLVCISFHSLEDRLVKQFFKDREREGIVEILTPKVVTASEQEVARNPSSRSACLRAIRLIKAIGE